MHRQSSTSASPPLAPRVNSFRSRLVDSLPAAFSGYTRLNYHPPKGPSSEKAQKAAAARRNPLLLKSTKVGLISLLASATLLYLLFKFAAAEELDINESISYSPSITQSVLVHRNSSGSLVDQKRPKMDQMDAALEEMMALANDMTQKSAPMDRNLNQIKLVNPYKAADLMGHNISGKVVKGSEFIDLRVGRVDVMEWSVYYHEGVPPDDVPFKGDVLLLHGQAFSSQNWIDIRLPNILAAAGYRTVAIDLPGYGRTGGKAVPPAYRVDSSFLLKLISALSLQRPALLSPSMSGSFSLPLLFKANSAISSFIPVAPVQTGDYSADQYREIMTPTLIVYGERDTSLGTLSAANLSSLPNSSTAKILEAGHACYLNQPEDFKKVLLNFLDLVRNVGS